MYKDAEKNRLYNKMYREKKKQEDPSYWARKGRESRYRNIDKARERERLYTEKHKERALKRSRKWYEDNPERHKEKRDKWRYDNYALVLAADAKRRAQQLNATPCWFEEQQVSAVYNKCIEVNNKWGTDLQVDHIIPLQGKNVCGLHCLANLQLLDSETNRRKNTKYQTDW